MTVNSLVVFVVVLLFGGLAVNVGIFETRKVQLQATANAAAIASSVTLQRTATVSPAMTAAQISTAVNNAGQAIAALNGFTNGSQGVVVTIQNPPTSGTYANNSYAVQATIQQSIAPGFLGILHAGNATVQGQAVHVVQPVSIASYYNVEAIVMDGTYIPSGGGLDGAAFGISAKLFSSVRNQNTGQYTNPGVLTWRGNLFLLGAPSTGTNGFNITKNGVLAATISLPSVKVSQILFLATTGYSSGSNDENFVVTYTDNSTLTQSINMSDWCNPVSNNQPEEQVLSMPYRLVGGTDYSGTGGGGSANTDTPTIYIYGYSINVDHAKTVKSLTLPSSTCCWYGGSTRPVILAVDLVY